MKNLVLAALGLLLCFSATSSFAQNAKYDSILAHMPSELTQQIYVLVNDGEQFQINHDYDSAIACYHRILKLVPNFAPALTTIAGYYGMSERYRDEVKWAYKAIAADSTYLNAYLNLGNAYASLKLYDSALMVYTTATHIDSRSPVPAYSLGVLAEERGQYREALRYYLISTGIDTTFTPGYYNAAMMYDRLGSPEDAKSMLLRELQVDEYAADAEQAYKAIEAREKEAQKKKSTRKGKK